jgi:prepilin-type N-terminal cleavage/methylation domain-containing protein/prepilin-type processing-associated H-X9-DG protein
LNIELIAEDSGLAQRRGPGISKKEVKARNLSGRMGFTLIELLVVIAIIAILAAILIPVLAAAQARARKITCVNNNHEIATAMLLYVSDYKGIYPPLNEKNLAFHTTNWWWVYLNKGNEISSTTITNNVWRCPEVKNTDINPGTGAFYNGAIVEGYGPFENYNNELNNLVRYNLSPTGTVLGGQNVNVVRRFSQIWLIGDVGVPKVNQTVNQLPPSGYYTEITTFQPAAGSGWLNGNPQKQAACRHQGRAVFSCADGHVESWKWLDLSTDFNDVFAENSF